MKKLTFSISFIGILILLGIHTSAQIAINTDGSPPDSSAMLDVSSANRGFLPPRVALTAANIAAPVILPAVGLHVFNTAIAGTPPNTVVPGDYYWNGIRWIPLSLPQGSNPGDLLYWNGSQWVVVPAGLNGQVLTLSNGVPTWGGPMLPIISTVTVSSISVTTASSGGNISSDGGVTITARGVCWSTNPNPTTANSHTSDGTGTGGFESVLTGMLPNTLYHIRAYATNGLGTSYGNDLSFTTLPFTCGAPITINHVSTGGVAPVDKSTSYGTVNNIPGEPSKCWITSNLGSDHQSTTYYDQTEASAGWYWQFNKKQGYKHTGTVRTPNTTWIPNINDNNDWQAVNDPCLLELFSGWRIPTYSEWFNVYQQGNWTNPTIPWNSDLKIHSAGRLNYINGSLNDRGYTGYYWSSSQKSSVYGFYLKNYGSYLELEFFPKAYGTPLRCLKDTCITYSTASVSISASANPVCAGTTVTFTATPTNGGTTPYYMWRVNGNYHSTINPVYSYVPSNGDSIRCVMTSNFPCLANPLPANSNKVSMTVNPLLEVSVSIAASANPVCAGTSVTFTATPTNGGSSPVYQWLVNGNIDMGATSYTYSYLPLNGDVVTCILTSDATCPTGNPATSNPINMTVIPFPTPPVEDFHSSTSTQIIWNWFEVEGAAGYKWNTTDDYSSAIDMGLNTSNTETGLECGTEYIRYVWAYNSCGHSVSGSLTQSTLDCFTCGSQLYAYHNAGSVAPVSKSVSYNTVTNIPGETSKCWITSNLGADHQASSRSDATEASAGWYWQFNSQQGYKHDGTTRTPNTTWVTYIGENTDWETANDPCALLLSPDWRLPTNTEWYNVDAAGSWTNWNGPWGSALKIHAAGDLYYNTGSLENRGSKGFYWSGTQNMGGNGNDLEFNNNLCFTDNQIKSYAFTVRCLR